MRKYNIILIRFNIIIVILLKYHDTSKCNGSDNCYQVVEYKKEKDTKNDNNIKKVLFIISIVGVLGIVIYSLTFVNSKNKRVR